MNRLINRLLSLPFFFLLLILLFLPFWMVFFFILPFIWIKMGALSCFRSTIQLCRRTTHGIGGSFVAVRKYKVWHGNLFAFNRFGSDSKRTLHPPDESAAVLRSKFRTTFARRLLRFGPAVTATRITPACSRLLYYFFTTPSRPVSQFFLLPLSSSSMYSYPCTTHPNDSPHSRPFLLREKFPSR